MTKTPNILVICSDQHHPGFTGYRYHPKVKTPNLDQLARDGAYFSRAYSNCPVCGPSRMSFMTGKYVHQIENWYMGVPLKEGEATWARELDQAGIPSTMIGKIDASGGEDRVGFTNVKTEFFRDIWKPYPRQQPFEKRLPGYTRSLSRRLLEDAGSGEIKQCGHNHHLGNYDHDRQVTDWTLEYIKEKGKKDAQPWALYVGFLQPHWPFRAPDKYFNMYYPDHLVMPYDAHFPNPALPPALQEWQQWNDYGEVSKDMLQRTIAAYYGMVTCLDDMIGEIIHALKEEGLYDNTYIIYMSDHGEMLGEHGLFFKHCPLAPSIGVPLILKGPGIPSGTHVDIPVSLVDLFPTIMDIAGLKWDEGCVGQSLLPFARGEQRERMQPVFAEFHGAGFRGAWYTLVEKEFKYTWYEFHEPTLYHIEQDPHEEINLANRPEYKHILQTFEQQLHAMLDPKATSRKAKMAQGLLLADGTDLTEIQKG